METKVYVDVLLVINYLINLLLVQCTAKLTGVRPKRRRMVLSSLFGSASALTIFLPFFGFVVEVLLRVTLASGVVLVAFSFQGMRHFFKQLFVFFAVSFFFSGIMLAVWMLFSPAGMLYHNGVVYFDISTPVLLLTAALAYGALSLANRLARDGRVHAAVYGIELRHGDADAQLQGLVDTGNALYDPFSNTPVMVCCLDDVAQLLPPGAAEGIRRGEHMQTNFQRYGLAVRLIPYHSVKGSGMLPAFRPDALTLVQPNGDRLRVERVYLALSTKKVGGMGYDALLNPDLIGVKV